MLHCEPCPELRPEIVAVDALHSLLAKNENGQASLQEMEALWRQEEFTDPGIQDAMRRLWRAIESEESRVRWERIHQPRE